MNKRFIIAAAVLVAVVVVAGVVLASLNRQEADQKIRVTASFYPLAEFARQVGGNNIEVRNMTPAGVEPHDFEPSPQDIVALQKSKVFIYSGAGFEPWAERALPDLKDVTIIKASEGITLLKAIPEEEEEGQENQGEKAAADPHFYLDPVLSQQIVKTIAEELGEIDPENRATYEKNAADYNRKLAALDKEYKEGLANCKRDDIITSHAAFAYLAKRYGFRQVAIAGLAEEEPSPARLAEVAKFARENNVKYIFFETLVSPRLSETIAREVGAKTLVLNPLEGLTEEEQKQGKDYISIMQDNLKNLRIALECE